MISTRTIRITIASEKGKSHSQVSNLNNNHEQGFEINWIWAYFRTDLLGFLNPKIMIVLLEILDLISVSL